MKELFFDYYMQIDYSQPVAKCNFTIKCIPGDNMRQKINNISIDMYPESKYSYGKDGLRNTQIYGVNDVAHSKFFYHITGKALTGLHVYEEEYNEDIDMLFKHPYGLNRAGDNIKKYYEKIKKEIEFQTDIYSRAVEYMHILHRDFHYVVNSTNIETTAEEAFTLGKGVCQDYAHILIAILHLDKIPARYVTGLIVGEGASHAWVEVLYEGKWYGLDPTNDMQVSTEHIKIGIGRDAKDCMLNRGIMHGGGLHTQTIKVSVNEVTDK